MTMKNFIDTLRVYGRLDRLDNYDRCFLDDLVEVADKKEVDVRKWILYHLENTNIFTHSVVMASLVIRIGKDKEKLQLCLNEMYRLIEKSNKHLISDKGMIDNAMCTDAAWIGHAQNELDILKALNELKVYKPIWGHEEILYDNKVYILLRYNKDEAFIFKEKSTDKIIDKHIKMLVIQKDDKEVLYELNDNTANIDMDNIDLVIVPGKSRL